MLALSIFSLTVLISGCGNLPATQTESIPEVRETAAPQIPENTVEHGGKYYVPREDLKTVLMMGLDKNEEDRPQNSIAYTNKMQSDFLMLLILDESAGVCDVLHLNRDTMTEIRRLGLGGSEAGTFVGQLALAHTFGSGGSDSCLNAVKAVSDLLLGVRIHHYMTLTMDAVAVINDQVGGVTLTLLEDFTELDPEMEKGREMTLMGDQALLYVRGRKNIGDSLNTSRMKRQEQYLEAFYAKLMEKNREDEAFLSRLLMKVNDSFMSDLTVNGLDRLGKTLAACSPSPFRRLEGELVLGEEYYEYHVSEEELKETVLELFYREWIP